MPRLQWMMYSKQRLLLLLNGAKTRMMKREVRMQSADPITMKLIIRVMVEIIQMRRSLLHQDLISEGMIAWLEKKWINHWFGQWYSYTMEKWFRKVFVATAKRKRGIDFLWKSEQEFSKLVLVRFLNDNFFACLYFYFTIIDIILHEESATFILSRVSWVSFETDHCRSNDGNTHCISRASSV